MKDANVNSDQQEVFSKAVRAGKRTYFFDVKSTKNNDFFLTITESKKRYNKDGRFFYEKHKIFLYKEDFLKFEEGFDAVIEFLKSSSYGLGHEPSPDIQEEDDDIQDEYIDVDFEDLEGVEASGKQNQR